MNQCGFDALSGAASMSYDPWLLSMAGRISSSCSVSPCRVTLLVGVLLCSCACGHPLYLARAAQTSAQLARAEQLDAAEKAPYEYYYALEHLRKARSEALAAEYWDAVALLQVAFDYASRAVKVSQRMEPVPPSASSLPAPDASVGLEHQSASSPGAP
jgi:hypothetical protein